MYRPRLIPLLLIENENLIKTINFQNPIYLGDPINALKIFNEKEVDEVCIIDKSATVNGINFKLLEDLANEAFMPLSYGGGITNLSDAKKIINIGFEKIIINKFSFRSLDLIKEISEELGSQAVVVSIDYISDGKGNRYCCYDGAKFKTKIDPLTHALNVSKHGAGELLITSIDHEGKMNGFDYSFIEKVTKLLNVPVIAHGGAGNFSQIKKVIYDHGASAVAIGSLFVFFGKKRGILINYPSFSVLLDEGIYKS
jgi:cyclase